MSWPMYVAQMTLHHAEADPHQPDGAVVFLGDSLTQGLAVAAVAPVAVNYGVASQDTAGLLAALPSYGVVSRARVVVLTIGTNDLYRGLPGVEQRLSQIAEAIDAPLVWHAIPPNARFDPSAVNGEIRRLCAAHGRCRYVETAFAPGDFTDGTHFTADGYRKWIATLSDAVSASASRPTAR